MIITCRQLVEAVTDAREDVLSGIDKIGYRAHLARCAACRMFVHQMDETVSVLRESRESRTGEGAPEALKSALLERLAQGAPKS